jgi:4,5:9,10-diseco-3-hydroxy-5,9,17-trioxoandrosta-1(10),2-diene-4-oate hydrolase
MERTITADGARLVLDDDGAGPPLVCLHAIGHDAGDFARLRMRLRDRHRVIAIDWPGQGRSPRETGRATAARYATLLAGVLDQLGVDACVLLGNSIGGAAALTYAAARPDRVRGLVLEDPGGLAPVDDRVAQVFLAGMARFFAAGARGARWFKPAFALYYRMVLQRPAAADARARIVGSAYEIAPVLADAWRGFAEPESDLRALAPRITCPVLFAWATRDRVIPLARCLPAIRTFPNARLLRFPAGHAAHLETPDEFERALDEFLDTLPETADAGANPPAELCDTATRQLAPAQQAPPRSA